MMDQSMARTALEAEHLLVTAEVDRLLQRGGAIVRALDELGKITDSAAPAPAVPVAGEGLPPAPSPAPSLGQKRTAAARATPRRKSTHADVASEALAAGQPLARAVAKHFGISEMAAQKWVQAARKAGHHIEADRIGRQHAVAAPSVPATVLMCDECEFEVAADHAADLNRHCLQVHNRRASQVERTPVTARGGDS